MSGDFNPYASPTQDSPRRTRSARTFISAHNRAVWVVVLLGIIVSLRLIAAVLRGGVIYGVGLILEQRGIPGWLAGVEQAAGGAWLLALLFMLVNGICFIAWFYRAYANLTGLGNRRTDHTPGWTIGAWFIPIGNLFLPYQMMAEIVRGSVPRVPGQPYTKSAPGMGLVRIWWTLWIVMFIGDQIARVLHGSTDLSGIVQGLWAEIGVDIATAAGGIVLLLLVRHVDASQAQRHQILEETPPPAPNAEGGALMDWLSGAQETPGETPG